MSTSEKSAYPDDNPKTGPGLKKPQLGLIPSVSLIEMAAAMALGAKKYSPYNWREKTVSSTVYLDAMERHMRAFLDGEDSDPESGASHLGHVMACCAILLDAASLGKLNDNRPTPGKFAEMSRAERQEVKPKLARRACKICGSVTILDLQDCDNCVECCFAAGYPCVDGAD